MKYRALRKSDLKEWLEMALLLWPKHSRKRLIEYFNKLFTRRNEKCYICLTYQDDYVGFVTLSIRRDYVDGSKTSPVGYVEGLYVKNKYRKTGIAKNLVKIGEKWMKAKGCKEVGSDTWLWNKESQKFHKKLGFKQTNILVHFIKKIN